MSCSWCAKIEQRPFWCDSCIFVYFLAKKYDAWQIWKILAATPGKKIMAQDLNLSSIVCLLPCKTRAAVIGGPWSVNNGKLKVIPCQTQHWIVHARCLVFFIGKIAKHKRMVSPYGVLEQRLKPPHWTTESYKKIVNDKYW